MSRPLLEIDELMIFKAAKIHCTNEEIAELAGCSTDTLERRFAAVLKKGRAVGRKTLRRAQWQTAMKGHAVMQIWLGKQILHQKDVSRIELADVPEEMLVKEVEKRIKHVKRAS